METCSGPGNGTRQDQRPRRNTSVHTIRVIPNRFMRPRDALLLNWSYWSVDWLRPIKQMELAKTGDAEKRLLLGEYTLSAKNEASSGGIFDLTTP